MTSNELLGKLVAGGESATLELKRSTGELREAMQTVCAFANGCGGTVVIGVSPAGKLVGQQVSPQTRHEIAAARERFEPPVQMGIEDVPVGKNLMVILLTVPAASESVPVTFDGRPFERIGNTTRRMVQARYEALLLERTHSRRRWENQPADEVTIRAIDPEEVRWVIQSAQEAGRLAGRVGVRLADRLRRLGLARDKTLLRAAVVLFGTSFLPDYPQCELRMARFLGRDKTEFLDQRQIRGPAFRLLEEAQLFCQRHFPLPGRIEPGRLQRQDRPLIPPEAMREILVNAIIHRDYSVAGGAVSLALFDDRVEIANPGRLPEGLTADALTREHLSIQRNPIIAEVFYRAGLIEKWGRGTNRVAEMCRHAGIPAPTFAEIAGGLLVTFHVDLTFGAGNSRPAQERPETRGDSRSVEAPSPSLQHLSQSRFDRIFGPPARPESRPESRPEIQVGAREGGISLEERLLRALSAGPLARHEIARALGQVKISGHLKTIMKLLLDRELITLTIPEKPNSRRQKYRLSEPRNA